MLRLGLNAAGTIVLLFMAYAMVVSLREHESRAARRALALAFILPLPYFILGIGRFEFQPIAGAVLLALTGMALVLLVVPFGRRQLVWNDTPTVRFDERDIMFSRRLLEPGTERFAQYYREHPEKKPLDDTFRAEPGLLAEGASLYHPYSFSAADASFTTVEQLRPIVDGEPAPRRVETDPQAAASFIKQWATKLGAVSVGVTELQDYHLYSVVGRGPQYGQPVTLRHRFAIALTVEMDKFMVDHAPFGPTLMESADQYLRSGAMAVQIAELIRGLGYPARAHIDGNYRVICPLVARDAGLGEIGRMGLLMTPALGPRVRIAVVTTDLPLATDTRRHDSSVIDFCVNCKKCADACPSRAIPFDDRSMIEGASRWRIDAEACFTLWCKLGTDCARCMRVCPYSHPDNALHNLVRLAVRNSSLARRLAMSMDDFFYGKAPKPVAVPELLHPASPSGTSSRHDGSTPGRQA